MGSDARSDRIKNKTHAYFDRIAAAGTEITEPTLCYRAVLERLRTLPRGRLADIGCGMGTMLSIIRDELPAQYELYGLDLSAESLKKAEEKCGGAVTLRCGDVEEIPFPDGSMDLLLCMHSFHHYPHPRTAMKEMYRILAPGGRLLLVENLFPFYKRWFWNISYFLRRYPSGDYRIYSGRGLSRLAREAGFSIGEHTPVARHSQLLCCEK